MLQAISSVTPMGAYPPKILAALNTVMAAVGYVQKKGKNTFQNYKYAGEGNLLEALRPAMVDAGLILIPSHRSVAPPDEHGVTMVCVEYTLAHKDGDVWPEKIIAYGSGGDKNTKGVGDKGLYKAITGANKYLLFKLFQIETGDDPENDSEHDKNGAPVATDDAPKNAPGISKARTWAAELIRDAMACENGEALCELLSGTRTHLIRICGVYPGLWNGPDGSGLRGEVQRIASIMEIRPWFDAFISGVEETAKNAKQEQV